MKTTFTGIMILLALSSCQTYRVVLDDSLALENEEDKQVIINDKHELNNQNVNISLIDVCPDGKIISAVFSSNKAKSIVCRVVKKK